ncbi:hypothetical protein ScPMuIL_016543 [Solemya velum]
MLAINSIDISIALPSAGISRLATKSEWVYKYGNDGISILNSPSTLELRSRKRFGGMRWTLSELLLLVLGALCLFVLCCHANGMSLQRNRRQTADVKIAAYMAKLGCYRIACGLIDVIKSGRRKRDLFELSGHWTQILQPGIKPLVQSERSPLLHK